MSKSSSGSRGVDMRTRWVLRAVSILLAVALWALVSRDGSDVSRTAVRTIPLDYQDIPEGYSLSDKVLDVEVRIEGAFDTLLGLNMEEIKASVSLHDLRAGKYRLPVRVETPLGVNVESYTPSHVEFELFRTIERTMFPTLDIPEEELADGADVTDVVFDPAEVVVKGKESDVLSVMYVGAMMRLNDFSDPDAWHEVEAVAQRANGSVVEGLTIVPSSLKVRAKKREPQTKISVPVNVPIRGTPGEGREVGRVAITPETVTLIGTKAALSNITELAVDPIDIAGHTEDIVIDIPLDNIGSGITIEGASSVRVHVEIHSPTDTMTFSGVPITVEGEGAFSEWIVSPAAASITVERTIASTEPFDPSAPPCTPYVDVTHVVSDRLVLPLLLKDLPQGMKIVRFEPQQVSVSGKNKKGEHK